ncbi:MAG: hypothetical protein F4Z72_00695 [Gemmatimonadales bacterium]|nr:hypothetical protein [Candidatus Palauibacter irciniicola]MYC17691.1 hypothetical protein [Gemmatimonadales bacterium]
MAVPDFQSLMLPTLQVLSNGRPTPVVKIRKRVAVAEALTTEDMQELLPSGRQPVFTNRIAWALVHMQRAGLVARAERGVYLITDDGKHLLSKAPARIDMKTLAKYPAYARWRNEQKQPRPVNGGGVPTSDSSTPEEILDQAAEQLRHALEAEVLDQVRGAPPSFLERIIVDLLVAMGYGGGDETMGHVTGGSGDGGIDGKIREDALAVRG